LLKSKMKGTAALLTSAAAAVGIVGGALATSVPAASAGTQNFAFNAVGSDTIFCVDNAIAPKYNKAQKATTGNKVYNTPPVLGSNATGCLPAAPTTFTVAADSVHAKIVYNTTTNLPPNGSSAGINALVADNGAGNIAYARSSAGRGSSSPSNIDFWAFAVDGVTWSSFSSLAPANLTATQISQIFTCQITDWHTVNASAPVGSTIHLYYPQSGSGTGKFFAQVFLGGVYPTSTAACPVSFVEENGGVEVTPANYPTATNPPSTGAADPNAIYPYSFGVWTAQKNGISSGLIPNTGETDLRNGAALGNINGTAPTKTSISETEAFANITGDACTSTPVKGAFCASRYVYHVTDQQLGINQPTYQAAILGEVGVPSSGVSTSGYCDNKYKSSITLFGFKPLALKTTAQSTSSDPVPGSSYCRQF
jgi:phosphate transport system substrate-binding protein